MSNEFEALVLCGLVLGLRVLILGHNPDALREDCENYKSNCFAYLKKNSSGGSGIITRF